MTMKQSSTNEMFNRNIQGWQLSPTWRESYASMLIKVENPGKK